MNENFTKADLKNIDFEATRKAHYGFFDTDDVIGYFDVVLKDGRKFVCDQDLDRVFTIHSDKCGDISGNMFAKMAADLIGNNDKFITIIEGAKIFAQNIMGEYTNHYGCCPRLEEILRLMSIKIVKDGFDCETLAVKLFEMGLDENIDYVTIKPSNDED